MYTVDCACVRERNLNLREDFKMAELLLLSKTMIRYFFLCKQYLPATLGPEVYSASNRNEYHKHKNNVSGE
jgi:hypothetical protein